MKEPKFRCGTITAIEALADELNLPIDPEIMEDWSYVVGNALDIKTYINHYQSTVDEDKKFVLMELIIQALEEQETERDFLKYWAIVKPLLTTGFVLHEYTIYYWSCFSNDDLDDCWNITPFMRDVWAENQK